MTRTQRSRQLETECAIRCGLRRNAEINADVLPPLAVCVRIAEEIADDRPVIRAYLEQHYATLRGLRRLVRRLRAEVQTELTAAQVVRRLEWDRAMAAEEGR